MGFNLWILESSPKLKDLEFEPGRNQSYYFYTVSYCSRFQAERSIVMKKKF